MLLSPVASMLPVATIIIVINRDYDSYLSVLY